jgi:hypothetical protein
MNISSCLILSHVCCLNVHSLLLRGHVRLVGIWNIFVLSVNCNCDLPVAENLVFVKSYNGVGDERQNLFFSTRDQDTSQNPASTEDALFDMFKNEETDLLPIGMFLAVSISHKYQTELTL